jgi:hypothetical protein
MKVGCRHSFRLQRFSEMWDGGWLEAVPNKRGHAGCLPYIGAGSIIALTRAAGGGGAEFACFEQCLESGHQGGPAERHAVEHF